MQEIMVQVLQNSLGRVLTQLAQMPEVVDSPQLTERVTTALGFYQQLALELEKAEIRAPGNIRLPAGAGRANL